MHGFYFAKVGGIWVQLATNTSRPFDEIRYPEPPMTVPIALATAAGVTPDYYLGDSDVFEGVPQYKEGAASFWLERESYWTANLHDQSTGVAIDILQILKATMVATTGDQFANAEIAEAAFQPVVGPAFWQDLVGCTETP